MKLIRKTFAKKERRLNASGRIAIDDINSHRGLGRSLAFGGMGGLLGGYAGKREAAKLDLEGKSEEEVMKGAQRKADKVGTTLGIAGGGLMALGSVAAGMPEYIPSAVYSAALSGGLASNAAGKNVRDKFKKRAKLEGREYKDEPGTTGLRRLGKDIGNSTVFTGNWKNLK